MTDNRVLRNAAALIDLLAQDGALPPAVIADRLGLARSSVYRLVEGTGAIGMTETLPDSTIRLSRRFLGLASAAARSLLEWAGAQEQLDDLAERTGQTAFLTVLRHQEAVCVAWAPASGIDLLILRPGRALPLHAGAAGRTLLAHSPGMLDALLADAPFAPFTQNTLTTAHQLEADVAETLEQGYTISDEDVTIGVAAIGVPVRRASGELAALSVGGPVGTVREGRVDLVAQLHATARALGGSATRDVKGFV